MRATTKPTTATQLIPYSTPSSITPTTLIRLRLNCPSPATGMNRGANPGKEEAPSTVLIASWMEGKEYYQLAEYVVQEVTRANQILQAIEKSK